MGLFELYGGHGEVTPIATVEFIDELREHGLLSAQMTGRNEVYLDAADRERLTEILRATR